MNWDQDLVAVTVNSHRVVVILVFVDSRRELDVNLFGDARRDHPLLLVSDLEVARLRGQDVEALRSRRIINESQLHSVRFICLEACELDYAGRSLEDAVRAYSVVSVLLGNADSFVRLGFSYDTTLNLDLVLTVGRGLVPEALFKLLTCGILEPKSAVVAADGGPASRMLGLCLNTRLHTTVSDGASPSKALKGSVFVGRTLGATVGNHFSGRHFSFFS